MASAGRWVSSAVVVGNWMASADSWMGSSELWVVFAHSWMADIENWLVSGTVPRELQASAGSCWGLEDLC